MTFMYLAGVKVGLYGPGFATGGSFTVGGSGGTDANLVQFMGTRGEDVIVRRKGQPGGDVNVNVNVINQTSAPVTAQQRRRPDGGIDVVLRDAVSRGIVRGDFDQPMGARFGIEARTGGI